jgi:kynurenine formamidase
MSSEKRPLADLPTFAELEMRRDAPPWSSWGLLGPLGTFALLDDEQVIAGIRTVRSGRRFDLTWPVNAFDPPTSATRRLAEHHIFQKRPDHRDDWIDSLYLQGTTQIDGLRHQAHAVHGFYDGTAADELAEDGGPLGVDRWAQAGGFVGRAVLVDVDRHLQRQRGSGLDHARGEAFPVSLLDEAIAASGVELRPRDILLIRTGWCEYYFDQMTPEARVELPGQLVCPGLAQSRETLAWIWDHQISLIASDTVAVEAVPTVATPDFRAIDASGRMHPPWVALLGLALGELWRLDEIAEACGQDGVYEMLVVAAPLNLPGGVGSPANAIAIR